MLITMSEKELHRLGVIKDICHKRITQVAAATLLNLTRRHIQRLVNTYRLHGDIGLVSKRVLSQTQIVGSKFKRHFSSDTIMPLKNKTAPMASYFQTPSSDLA